jgi:hypothetical protein
VDLRGIDAVAVDQNLASGLGQHDDDALEVAQMRSRDAKMLRRRLRQDSVERGDDRFA